MNASTTRFLLPLVLALGTLSAAGAAEVTRTSCEVCHGDSDLFEAEMVEIVSGYAADVHADAGLSCHDCHGGDPDPGLADDMDAAKREDGEGGFVGAPARADIPAFCGECHSDPLYMRRFKPDARVDQEAEYWTSQHGEALAAGDTAVATCTDCHGAHGTQRASSPTSRIHPTRVAATCGECHSDAETMAGYTLADGRPLPTDQQARWRQSVHAEAMYAREDLSAPTCNDCHGNHGARPPGLDSIAFVCGQCHGRAAEIFRASAKHEGYQEHNEWLQDVGEEGCAACHDSPMPALASRSSFAECSSCHRNHAVISPTVAMFGELPETPCGFCHQPPDTAEELVLESERSRSNYLETLELVLADAREAGLGGTALFDHLVDVAWGLPAHSLPADEEGEGTSALRPEFAELFSKFRIGKTSYERLDPTTGATVTVDVVRCSTCHVVDGAQEELEAGAATGIRMAERMHELTVRTASAERTLLTARRGGVATHGGLEEIEQAVDAQIGLQVLVHTFSDAPDGAFEERYAEGIEHADAALLAGEEALAELGFRRRGLGIATLIIVMVLIGLGLKIREISRREAAHSS